MTSDAAEVGFCVVGLIGLVTAYREGGGPRWAFILGIALFAAAALVAVLDWASF